MCLLPLLLVALLALNLPACKKDHNDPAQIALSNHDQKMKAVTDEVKNVKKHDKALLLVSFGSTWEAPQKTFANIKKAFADKFTDRDVYFAFTSEICMTRCIKKVNKHYYAPQFYLEALGLAGYKDIAVQSLHVIPGEEYLRLKGKVKDFHNSGDHPKFGEVTVYLAGPLLEEESDCQTVADALHKVYGDKVTSNIVCFMGHGNPDGYDYQNGNSRYTMMEKKLQALNPNYFVGTVDMKGNLVNDVVKRIKAAGKASGNVMLHPLMSIAGDHANNDMKGGTNPTEPEEGSWRQVLGASGFTCTLNDCTIMGLADYPPIVNVWISHMEKALAADPMYPEKEE